MDHFFPNFFTRCNVPFVTLRSDKAERPVLQLTTLPEKQKHLWRKSSITSQSCRIRLQPNHTPGGFPIAKPSLPKKNGGAHVPTVVFCPDVMGCSRGSLSSNSESFASTSCWGHLPPGSHFRDRIRRRRSLERIPKPPSSTSATRRSHEDIFFRPQPASPGVHPAETGVVVHMLRERHRCWFCLSLAPTQQVSDQRLLDLGLAVGSSQEMFRSRASSLISSSRYLPAR